MSANDYTIRGEALRRALADTDKEEALEAFQERLVEQRRAALWRACERIKEQEARRVLPVAWSDGGERSMLVVAILCLLGVIGVMMGMVAACVW